ncbi:mucin-17 [Synchiropus splendidus]|uniref:mucin-17 n=1 Tax=Synchiropus splendidus TaxID=270530 RepID=UPI00237EAF1B|nr:mucin-17 [Synchiropus splendidus]
MQPHLCLLLLVFTTDETWSLCGGDIRLDQNRPAGHVSLIIPGIRSHVTRPAPQRTCLWVLGLPEGRAVRLVPGSGVSVTAGCPGDPVLERSGAILLSGCDRAHLTWTGSADSAEVIQLQYSVLNSEQNRSSPPPRTSVPQESWVTNLEVRVRPTTADPGPRAASCSPAPQWTTLPEEAANNGAETSGASATPLSFHSVASHTHTVNPHSVDPHTSDPHTVDSHTTDSHTSDPHTSDPHTSDPHTTDPHTSDPHTLDPHTSDPHTVDSHTVDSHTVDPHTSDPHTVDSHTVDPHTSDSHTTDSHTSDLHTSDPHTTDSHTTDPHTSDSHTSDPHTSDPHTSDSHTSDPHTSDPHTSDPHTSDPHTSDPHTSDSHTTDSHTTDPHTSDPHTSDPHTSDPHTSDPHTSDPHTVDSHTSDPHTTDSHTTDSHTTDSHTSDPHTSDPHTSDPHTVDSHTSDPHTSDPHTSDPHTTDSHTSDPHTSDPHTSDSHTTDSHTTDPHTVDPHTSDSVAPPTVDSLTDQLGSVSQTRALPLTTSELTVSPELGTPARVWTVTPHREGPPTERGPREGAAPPTASLPGRAASTSQKMLPGPVTSSGPRSPPPKFFIVPDQPATIRVKTVELLLQMVVEDPRAAAPAGLQEATSAWVAPYLQRAAGFTRVLDVWSSGRAVQSLLEFRTSGALQWMGSSASLLHTTGLDLALRDGTLFRKSRLSNITVGGLHADVCHWLLQCPAGFNCRSRSGNFSCSSVCHSDHCQHQGLCTHHTQHLPVCRCLVGDDFWFMGRRCEVRMTRARLVGMCLAGVLLVAAVIGALALAAVRRYRAALIRAKVEQTRSSYHRFDRFDELSARLWARGSADSLDDGDELLHLRAPERPCCYHDDTLSLPSTCPSHLNTVYSAQTGRRGSEADAALDSGKVSDLSVCSWTLEPIHWTPFPLLQQLASASVELESRESRPGSCCEALEPLSSRNKS